MHYLKHLSLYSLLATLLLSGCSAGRRSFSAGETFEADGRYEEAMYSYADAFQNNPEISDYRIRFLKARDKAAELHYKRGNELFQKGNYVAALTEFQTSAGLDPTQGRYQTQVEATVRLKDAQLAYQDGVEFETANKFKEAFQLFTRAVELDPENKEYRAAQTRVAGLRKSKLEGYELSLKSAKPITLKFKDAKIKDVFNIVTQLSGINFIFDEGVKDQPVTIYIENATFQQVLDLLTNMHKLGRKIANESTVIIYARNPEKTKQYEDMTLRTFHLSYMDAKKAVNLIRTMLQVRKIYVNEESNALVVRDTDDVVAVVEKILEANDVPEPEVILDVEVIEVSDNDSKRLGLLLSTYNVKLGAFNPFDNTLLSDSSLTPSTTTIASGSTTATTSTVTINNLIKAFSIQGYGGFLTVPNATYNFAKTLSKSEVLSNPKIRVRNKEKSKFTVGTRVPITTTNTTNNTVSVNVQYVDVGVKLNAEPNIQLNNEVVIKLSLEVSQTVGAPQIVGDTSVVTIGTRNLETVLSLKDGETSIIGGLIQHTNSDAKNKIFLLSDIPLLGPFLTDTNASNNKTELMLAITPRLVRGVIVPQNSLTSFSSGKEDEPSLVRPLASFDLEPDFEASPKPAVHQAAPQAMHQPPQQGEQQPPQPMFQAPVPQPGQPPESPSTLPAGPEIPQPGMVPPAPAPPQRGILQISAPVAASVGQQFTLEVKAGTVSDLSGAPFVLTYDPVFVEFLSATEGLFLKKDGAATTFSTSPDPAAGAVAVNLVRPAGQGGASGGGTLATLVFRAKNKGPASFGLRDLAFTSSSGQPLAMLPFSTAMEIR
jgi:general secretion pathway protein D